MFDYTKNTGQIGINREKLIPHPDGRAWPKCCHGGVVDVIGTAVDCAFIKNQRGGARLSADQSERIASYEGIGAVKVSDIPFMCCHRSTDDGYYRVCAGWDACFGNKSRRNEV